MNIGNYGGFLGLVLLVLDIWALINVLQSGTEMPKKVGWVVLILFLPLLGFLIWAFVGPRGKR